MVFSSIHNPSLLWAGQPERHADLEQMDSMRSWQYDYGNGYVVEGALTNVQCGGRWCESSLDRALDDMWETRHLRDTAREVYEQQ